MFDNVQGAAEKENIEEALAEEGEKAEEKEKEKGAKEEEKENIVVMEEVVIDVAKYCLASPNQLDSNAKQNTHSK